MNRLVWECCEVAEGQLRRGTLRRVLAPSKEGINQAITGSLAEWDRDGRKRCVERKSIPPTVAFDELSVNQIDLTEMDCIAKICGLEICES